MVRVIVALSAALSVLLLFSSYAYSEGLPGTVLKVKPSIVAVGSVQKTRRPPTLFRGTGFVVGDGRLVVTNAHVLPEQLDIQNNEYLAVFTEGNDSTHSRNASIVALDKHHDLALLKIEGEPLPALNIGDSDRVLEGEFYAFTGFPIGVVLGHYPVTHRGMISAITPIVLPARSPGELSVKMIRRLRSPFNVFQLDATAYPGNSGSPLYDYSSGQVIGVVNSVFVKETKEAILSKPSGITYAIPAKYIKRLLDKYYNKQ
ncbi:MAG: trypsin-like peptidase domain-containing protein [Gammaproteobacteria bacterium]|nr:trypsin-like peptidase domain-containing protein [Gammaproteobacteria bacterium]